jgi:hypothetical protein
MDGYVPSNAREQRVLPLSFAGILGILGVNDIVHGMLSFINNTPMTPVQHIICGLITLGLAVSISGLLGLVQRVTHAFASKEG